jgi:hypothetical protein
MKGEDCTFRSAVMTFKISAKFRVLKEESSMRALIEEGSMRKRPLMSLVG